MPDTEKIRLALSILSGRRVVTLDTPLKVTERALLGLRPNDPHRGHACMQAAERTILDAFADLERRLAALESIITRPLHGTASVPMRPRPRIVTPTSPLSIPPDGGNRAVQEEPDHA